ncbi:MAG: hypothetical protein B7X30_12465 [Thiomonas sp. 13-64-67]|nr:MAG: hypothetical protein B7X30_12465 [Thiomonas sp. 13-64-67]
MLWLIAVISIALIEYSSKSEGFFVFQNLPVGLTFEGNKIKLPDGKIIVISEEDEFKLRYEQEKAGKPILPWEIDWARLTSVPKVPEIRWFRLVLLLLAPFVSWLFIEAAVLIAAWVRRGFASNQRDS